MITGGGGAADAMNIDTNRYLLRKGDRLCCIFGKKSHRAFLIIYEK
ncbi:hypothetical protein QUB70_09050 [Microcoleus sp. A003_D6]